MHVYPWHQSIGSESDKAQEALELGSLWTACDRLDNRCASLLRLYLLARPLSLSHATILDTHRRLEIDAVSKIIIEYDEFKQKDDVKKIQCSSCSTHTHPSWDSNLLLMKLSMPHTKRDLSQHSRQPLHALAHAPPTIWNIYHRKPRGSLFREFISCGRGFPSRHAIATFPQPSPMFPELPVVKICGHDH